MEKTLCASSQPHIFLYACVFYFSTVAGKEIERIEIEVQVGATAATKLIKQINLSQEEVEEENAQGTPALLKLKKILNPSVKRSSSSSSSSSSSAKLFSSSSSSSSSKGEQCRRRRRRRRRETSSLSLSPLRLSSKTLGTRSDLV